MGHDAELVVLSIGLAIRDMAAIHFVEDDEFPSDFPHWVQQSPFGISDVNRLMDVWAQQLPKTSNNSEDAMEVTEVAKVMEVMESKGKCKRKAAGASRSCDVQPPDEGLQDSGRHPA